MDGNPQDLEIVWRLADGRETLIESRFIRIDLGDELWLSIAFNVDSTNQITVDCHLHGQSPARYGSRMVGSRFVIIPVTAASLLLGVAEVSDTPSDLLPTAAHAVWKAPGGQSMNVREGSFEARTQHGHRVTIALVAGPGGAEDTCILNLFCEAQKDVHFGENGILTVPLLEPETVRFSWTIPTL